MKIKNILKTKATKQLDEEIEEELKKEDPSIVRARAVLYATRNNRNNTESNKKDSS